MDLLREFYQTTFSSNLLYISLLLLFPLLYALLKNRSNGLNLPPSPPKLPIIGNLHQIGKLPHQAFRSLAEKYGPLMLLHFGSVPTVVVTSADVADEILKKHDLPFSDRPHIKALDVLLYGGRDVILAPYGDYWRQAKKICVIHLLNQSMVRAFQSIRDEEVFEMFKQIDFSCLKGSESMNFSEIFGSVTNNVVFRSATGRRCDDKAYNMTHKEWLEKLKKLVEAFCFEDLFPSLRWMDSLTGFNGALKRTFMEMDDFLGQIIDDHRDRISDGNVSGKKDFVDIILHLQREGLLDVDLAKDDIKGIINSIFSAATDTASVTLEWTLSELMKHPNAMKKVQDEIRRVVGEKSEIISAVKINQMQFLKCVIKEALRLHSFGLVPRRTLKAVKLCGYDIPANAQVLVNVWGINRDAKVWDRPDEFIPERFLGSRVDFMGEHKGYIPFGFGRRKCPGGSFGSALMETVLANLLYRYDFESLEKVDLEERFQLSVSKKKPLYLVPKLHFPTSLASLD